MESVQSDGGTYRFVPDLWIVDQRWMNVFALNLLLVHRLRRSREAFVGFQPR